jgi:murein DD-endopeptidase MepM/ murein hydrolase activator NlpD
VTQPLSVRTEPGLAGPRGPQVLEASTVIECDEDSRCEVDGYVWLWHDLGWSAERSVDFAQVFLEAAGADSTAESSSAADAATPAEKSPQQAIARKRAFKVMQPLSVRAQPGLNAQRLPGTLEVGMVIECEEDSRCEVDEHIWWRHNAGWSAEARSDGSIVFLRDPDAVAPVNPDGSLNMDGLPLRDGLFQRLPVDLHNIAWVQYFGNTSFAFREGRRWNYPAFSQGLHSGIDLASRVDKLPVYAGIAGVFLRNDGFGVAVRSGEYVIIYQHLTGTTSYVRGGPVTPDTTMGVMDPALGDNRHLHLEVRYDRERWIINPLWLMPPPMRDGISRKFGQFAAHFYRDQHWTRWQSPLDQPAILRGGPVIGPMAR